MSLRRQATFLTLIAVLCAFLVAVPASAQFSAQEIAFIENVEFVPTNTAEMALFDRTEQKLILRSLTPEAQSAFWTGKLHDYVAAHPELGADQVDFIQYAASLATPSFFAASSNGTLRPVIEKTIEGLSAAALNVFDADDIGAIFIGVSNEPAQCSPSFVGKEAPGRAPTKASCNCRWGQGGCGYCSQDGCTPTTNGCGWFGAERCTKTCYL